MTYSKPRVDTTEIDYIRREGLTDFRLAHGTISLQAETHPIDFRKIELQELK